MIVFLKSLKKEALKMATSFGYQSENYDTESIRNFFKSVPRQK
jgi:hypothetical protein